MSGECEKAGKEDSKKNRHACSQCPMTFDSGKALGGHMSSAHVQPGKDVQGQKQKCPEPACEREFESPKALHGHMRAHGERRQRGTKEPITNTVEPGDYSNGPRDSGTDVQSGLLSCRPEISGRGCNNGPEQEASVGVQSGLGLTFVVDVNKPMFSGPVTGGRWSSQAHESATRKLLELTSCDYTAKDKNVANSSQGSESANQINNLSFGLMKQPGDISSGNMRIHEKHEDTNGVGDVTKISTPSTLHKFACTRCNMTFDRHQALGGHKASHTRKNKVHFSNTIDEHSNEQPKRQKRNAKSSHNSQSGSNGVTSEQGASTHVQLHKCHTCNRNFDSHKRLKTHERSHPKGPAQVSPSHVATSSTSVEISGPVPVSPSHVETSNASNVAKSGASESNQAPRNIFVIDLNKSPEMEED